MSHDLKKNKYIPLIEKENNEQIDSPVKKNYFLKIFPSYHC